MHNSENRLKNIAMCMYRKVKINLKKNTNLQSSALKQTCIDWPGPVYSENNDPVTVGVSAVNLSRAAKGWHRSSEWE